jgi:hypothetical protein
MKHQLQTILLAAVALGLSGCASTSVKHSWKSPDCRGRKLQKVAILAVDERDFVRQALESRFLRDLREHGQTAMDTWEVLPGAAIQADKESAGARFRAEGADVILIVRLLDQSTYNQQAMAYPQFGNPVASGYDNYEWFDFYSIAFATVVPSWGTTKMNLLLDSSLFDLKTKKRLWSALSLTKVNEDEDKLVVADALVAKIVNRLHQDGLVSR